MSVVIQSTCLDLALDSTCSMAQSFLVCVCVSFHFGTLRSCKSCVGLGKFFVA